MSRKKGILIILIVIVAVVMVFVILFAGGDKKGGAGEKIGLIITGECTEHGWNGAHFQGASDACEEFGMKLIVKENILEGTNECKKAVEELVSEGAGLIFLSSTNYTAEVIDTVKKYPDVEFFCITDNMGAGNLRSYFARMYQARYISGAIAACQSETHILGYVAAEKNSEVIRGIDAFALGARSVSPETEIDVIFTGEWDNGDKERAAADRLITELGADVITYHQNLPNAAEEADSLGVYSIGYHEKTEGLSDRYLTSIVWNWRVIYREIIKDYNQSRRDTPARYWLGIEYGAAGLTEYSPLVSGGAAEAALNAENRIKNGQDVFSGLIIDNEGNIRCGEDEAISDDILFSQMDWFVSGVNIYE